MDVTSMRSSCGIQGLAPHIDIPSSKAVYLPHELKVAVLAQLDKGDLKTVRLVSKEWNALATRPLFDRVYISCRAHDSEIVKNITRHPVISTGIREPLYDGSFFIKNFSFRDYFDDIYEGVVSFATYCQPGTTLHSKDAQINNWFRYCRRKSIDDSKFYRCHGNDTFLVEGRQIYKDCAAFECHYREGGGLLDDSTGLGSLRNLRSVVLSHDF